MLKRDPPVRVPVTLRLKLPRDAETVPRVNVVVIAPVDPGLLGKAKGEVRLILAPLGAPLSVSVNVLGRPMVVEPVRSVMVRV